MKKYTKIIVIALLLTLVGLFFAFDLKQYLSLDYLKSQQQQFVAFYEQNPLGTLSVYMLIYIATTALSLPGAALLTLLGGALFGVVTGTIAVSFASTMGATFAFLTARFLLRDWVQEKFASQLKTINKGVEEEGAFYLFTLRLIPAVPFFVINLVMGLTPMPTLTFFLVSQIGMLAGTLVYVNAGTQLSQIESLSGIASPQLIGSFVVLGLFPIVTKKIMNRFTRKKGNQ
jgi:uncharacterized membrane protein YdjX (TVP38/TMEM64 family)